jgi:hypothetical protein
LPEELLMTRAAWLIAACTLSLSPLALAQEFPTPGAMPPLRYAQAPAAVAPAQPPVPPLPPRAEPERAPIVAGSMSELTPTPEMWFYEREREEYQDPRNAVRAAAEFKSDQRRRRLESMQWFGYSNARPRYAFTPFTTTASPQWGSNTQDPYIWGGVGRSTIVHLPASPYWR